MCAVRGGHNDIVSRLLKHPGIILGMADSNGDTALHWACDNNNVSIVKLLCQDSRCSPGVVNKKDSNGDTPLMSAVLLGDLDIVRELDREGTDFFTKDSDGMTLIEWAREMKNNEDEVLDSDEDEVLNNAEDEVSDCAKVLEYLMERNKVDSLRVIAAHNVARNLKNSADVEALEIPWTVRKFLAGFVNRQ